MSDRHDIPQPVNNERESRFEIALEGSDAELVYQREGDRLVLVHTGVPEELEGRGIGGVLVRAAIAAAASEGLVVVPRCPFARRWLRKHPEVAEQVRIEWPNPSASVQP